MYNKYMLTIFFPSNVGLAKEYPKKAFLTERIARRNESGEPSAPSSLPYKMLRGGRFPTHSFRWVSYGRCMTYFSDDLGSLAVVVS